jgi:putative FmdB family regulatory protein
MPLYEYECDACHHRFERIQKFSDPPVDVCPKCGKSSVKKLLSSPAIQFKGSGWYVTDYARKPAPDSAAKSTSSDTTSSTPASTSSATSETASKPAEKSEKKKD